MLITSVPISELPSDISTMVECIRLGTVITTVLHLLLLSVLHTASVASPLGLNKVDCALELRKLIQKPCVGGGGQKHLTVHPYPLHTHTSISILPSPPSPQFT